MAWEISTFKLYKVHHTLMFRLAQNVKEFGNFHVERWRFSEIEAEYVLSVWEIKDTECWA